MKQSKIQNPPAAPKRQRGEKSKIAPVFVRATGAGVSGIATLVLDGWGLVPKLQPLLKSRKTLREAQSGELLLARLVDAQARVVDEVIVTFLAFDETETGHEQIELSCHGGAGSISAVEETLLAAGFKRGGGHELLARAHLNGKLSLLAVEARLRLSRTATSRQAEFLLGYAALQKCWERRGFDAAMGLRAREWARRETLHKAAEDALARARAGMKLLATHHVTISGPVNAGKSTLVNLLARAERHLVSEIPGTTRDRLDVPVAMRGLDVLLTDTAGLRETADELEREGQRRARAAARSAALRLVLLDGSQPPGEAELKLIAENIAAGPTLVVLNKQDLGIDDSVGGLGFLAGREPCIISAKTGFGLAELEATLQTMLLGDVLPESGDPFTARQARHLQELVAAIAAGTPGLALLSHIRAFLGTRPDEAELRAALNEVGC